MISTQNPNKKKKLQYSCGCSFNTIDNDSDKIDFDPVHNPINFNCSKTWALIGDGNTKGCFQLESRLGRSMAKKLKPTNIEELSALISILRPGCLEAVRDGKTVSNHYIDKKNGQESIDYYHPALEETLGKTYGEMIYQEQAMEIAKNIAGFNLQEADMLRKAIGKKKPEEMAKVKSKFLNGSKELGVVSFEQAEEIFGWIEKSQRYSFNKSHAVSYAVNAYLSAYAKAHFPRIFFASYLRFAKDKIDPKAEIKELIQNANAMDIGVYVPDIRNMNKFFVLKNNHIYFGLTDIKGFGDSVYNKLCELIKKEHIDFDTVSWLEFACKILLNINSISAKSLIKSGSLSFLKKSRTSMLFEYELLGKLTKKESGFICDRADRYKNLNDALLDLFHNHRLTNKRSQTINTIIQTFNKPPYSLQDSPEWIADSEEEILGCSITCSKVDMYDISMTNATCKDFHNMLNTDNIIVCGEIDTISIIKTKSGKNPGAEMAFVSMSDGSGVIDSVIFFPEAYKEFRNILFQNNVIIVKGNKTKSKDGLVVQKAYIPRT
jgi:DNA polymerase-3 subunit alpha